MEYNSSNEARKKKRFLPLHMSVLACFGKYAVCSPCCCSVTQSCPTLSTPWTAAQQAPHHLPKFAQVHVHCFSDAIQPSHHLTPSCPSALNLSQPQGLFP